MNFRTLAAALVLSLAACNSGSSSSSVPTISTQSVAVPVAGTTSALPSAGGITPTFTWPTLAGAPSTLSVTSSTTLPTGLTAFSADGPVALGNRSVKSTVAGSTALLYIGFTAPANITASGAFTATFGLPSVATPGTSYYIAAYSGGTWFPNVLNQAGSVNSAGTTVTFSSSLGFTLSSGSQYAVVLYSVPTATATPSPTPSAAATPNSSSVTLSTVNQNSISGLPVGSTAVSLTAPVASVATSVALAGYSTLPSSLPTFTYTYLDGVVAVTPTANVSFTRDGTYSAAVTLPSGVVPTGNYKIAEYNSANATTGWVTGLGTSSVSGQTVTISFSPTITYTLIGGQTYYYAVYQ